MKKIPIASDHAGFEIKELLKKYLKKRFEVFDFGPFSDKSMDYPDTGLKLSEAVASGKFKKGILLCGSGIGMSIVANKVKGIRAALCHNTEFAKLSRFHNDSNIVVLPARFLSIEEAKNIVDIWLKTEFLALRHQNRIDKISRFEDKNYE